jgi:hypothetical protein
MTARAIHDNDPAFNGAAFHAHGRDVAKKLTHAPGEQLVLVLEG